MSECACGHSLVLRDFQKCANSEKRSSDLGIDSCGVGGVPEKSNRKNLCVRERESSESVNGAEGGRSTDLGLKCYALANCQIRRFGGVCDSSSLESAADFHSVFALISSF